MACSFLLLSGVVKAGEAGQNDGMNGRSLLSCALQTAAASHEPFEKCSLAPHDPGPMASINKRRFMAVGRFIRNRDQRSIGDLQAGALACEKYRKALIRAATFSSFLLSSFRDGP